MMRLMIALFALLTVTDAVVLAGPPRRYRQWQSAPMVTESMPVQQAQVTTARYVDPSASVSSSPTTTSTASATGSDDALNEVNAARAQRGLKPFLPDPLLNQAAQACAKQRCARHIDGHLPESDFKYLPAGASANAAGCGALEPSWGWGTCCTYDNYTYAGAAWVMGADGKRYMHLFVR
ncbi:MAG TPA: CAP domain-containing protein [Gemmatales bacterium]|nr:CAP domain-containing protein [Gemmatales bacterium]